MISRGTDVGGVRKVIPSGPGVQAEALAEVMRATLALWRAEARLRRAVLNALRAGVALRETARVSRLSRGTIRRWRDGQ